MPVSETQFKGWRLHRRKGEAYPYYNAIASASLQTPYSTLNIAPILPAGTTIIINGHLYVTRNTMTSGQWGEMDPRGWHPSYIVPKKFGDTFADRAAVYWDATNCRATSTAGGNLFIGLAVANGDLGTATNATGSTLTTAANGASSVSGGTSADGLVGGYASADLYMEVEMEDPSYESGAY
jgi:predicted RecA/RadA family phage recombinase